MGWACSENRKEVTGSPLPHALPGTENQSLPLKGGSYPAPGRLGLRGVDMEAHELSAHPTLVPPGSASDPPRQQPCLTSGKHCKDVMLESAVVQAEIHTTALSPLTDTDRDTCRDTESPATTLPRASVSLTWGTEFILEWVLAATRPAPHLFPDSCLGIREPPCRHLL